MAAPLEYEVREEYQSYSLGQLLDAPVTCFQGVGEIQSELLERYFNITTVRQLAEMPSFVEALAVQETVLEGGEMISRSVAEASQAGELEFHIRRSDLEKKISELPESPIHVLDGVTPGQDLALYDAFRITKVTQMAQNRIMLEARIIEYLSREGNGEEAEGGDGALSSVLGARAASSLAGRQRAMSDEFTDTRIVQSAGEISDHVRSRVDAMRERAQETPAPTQEGALGAGETTADRLSAIRESRGAAGSRGADMERIRGGGEASRTDDILSSRTPAGAGRNAALSVANQRGAAGREGDLAASRGAGSRTDSVISARQSLGRGGPPPGGAQVRTPPSPTGGRGATTATQEKPKKETTLPTEEEVTAEKVVETTPPPPRTNPVPWIVAGAAALLVLAVGGYFLFTQGDNQGAKQPPPQQAEKEPAPGNTGPKTGGLTAGTETPRPPPIRTHSVLKKDTLWRISIREYSDPLNWPSIFEANKDKINNPDLIYPAQEFRIPDPPEYKFPAFPKGYKRSR